MPKDRLDRKSEVPVVILCGGEGTRFHEETQYRPKPLAEIGGLPILCHIMQSYSRQGYTKFILCLGYKGFMIKEFFLDFEYRTRDFTLKIGDGSRRFHGTSLGEDWEITFVETGQRTMTGARIKKIEQYVDTETFMVTYGDGLSDVDLGALMAFHQRNECIGTVTSVSPSSQFGEMRLDGKKVVAFTEKPKTAAVINGGFFVFDRKFFEYVSSDEGCVLEQEPLTRLAKDGQLCAYAHQGFWQCMDTFKDYRQLNQLWDAGVAPWANGAS
jgi:glucose-1-phosphate cytidylyltransferase